VGRAGLVAGVVVFVSLITSIQYLGSFS
jgi:hypothetical protein